MAATEGSLGPHGAGGPQSRVRHGRRRIEAYLVLKNFISEVKTLAFPMPFPSSIEDLEAERLELLDSAQKQKASATQLLLKTLDFRGTTCCGRTPRGRSVSSAGWTRRVSSRWWRSLPSAWRRS